jgi:hypothetical protein
MVECDRGWSLVGLGSGRLLWSACPSTRRAYLDSEHFLHHGFNTCRPGAAGAHRIADAHRMPGWRPSLGRQPATRRGRLAAWNSGPARPRPRQCGARPWGHPIVERRIARIPFAIPVPASSPEPDPRPRGNPLTRGRARRAPARGQRARQVASGRRTRDTAHAAWHHAMARAAIPRIHAILDRILLRCGHTADIQLWYNSSTKNYQLQLYVKAVANGSRVREVLQVPTDAP